MITVSSNSAKPAKKHQKVKPDQLPLRSWKGSEHILLSRLAASELTRSVFWRFTASPLVGVPSREVRAVAS